MKISNIKINGFGKLEEKEYSFKEGINLVIGSNESGKTTFAKCLQSMFYGISRTKDGKPISDYEKYKPWNEIPFTAKIDYSLDNGEKYEVFRDFNKRNTKIFNSNLDDISDNYSIDKAKNSNYFSEQTGVAEELFLKTAVIQQQEVKLNKLEQNIILQKLSNLVSTGDDTISFKKLMDKLNKKQLEEVGTNRSSEKPINIVMNKIEKCNEKLRDINLIKNRENNMSEESIYIQKALKELEQEIALLKELQNVKTNEKLEQSKIDTIRDLIEEYEEKIRNAEKEIKTVKNKNGNKRKIGLTLAIATIIYTILFFVLQLPMPAIAISAILIIPALYLLFKQEAIPDTKTVLLNSKKEKEKEIEELISKQENAKLSTNDYIRNKYGNAQYLNLTSESIVAKLTETEREYTEKKLAYNTLTVNSKTIQNQIEELSQTEEELNALNEEFAELNSLNNSINIAKEALNEAYEEIKNSITPEFTKYLSKTIGTISNDKYTQVKFDDEQGLIVQLANGDYINCELLSIGTIDQMYIALRLATLKEATNETLPIILDEAFVYFDTERLGNILKFISEEFKQTIIFSCSNREKELLEKLNIQHNTIYM